MITSRHLTQHKEIIAPSTEQPPKVPTFSIFNPGSRYRYQPRKQALTDAVGVRSGKNEKVAEESVLVLISPHPPFGLAFCCVGLVLTDNTAVDVRQVLPV